MNDARHDTGPSLERQRDHAIAQLADHFARDSVGIEELERRIDAVQRAQTVEAVRAVTRDLPALPVTAGAAVPEPPRLSAPPGSVVRSGLVFALMSGTVRRGGWVPPQRLYVTAIMGGCDLDFREARLGPGITEVFVLGAMGGVDIVVPPDLPVEVSGIAVMGGWSDPLDARHPEVPGQPEDYHGEPRLLRIRGFAIMGGIDVHVRLPGESARDAARRRREERRRGRRDSRG